VEARRDPQSQNPLRTLKIFRRYYVQLLTLLVWLNNQMTYVTKGSNEATISWGGYVGFPEWYDSWVTFDVEIGKILLWGIITISNILPLEGKYRAYATCNNVMILAVLFAEFVSYKYFGNNVRNEQMFPYYFGAYLVGITTCYFTNKCHKNG